MKRVLVVLFVIAILLGVGWSGYSQRLFTANIPKNIIIISIDTLRQDHMGVYGYGRNTTPNIDKWSENATVFKNAYTQVPITYSSFASLMTGLNPFESNIYSNYDSVQSEKGFLEQGNLPLDSKITTLAEILQENSYATGAFILNPVLDKNLTNIDQGFDEYSLITPGEFKNPERAAVELVTGWIDKNSSGAKPMFLWMHLLDPHTPYLPTPESACRFNTKYCGKDALIKINKIGKLHRELDTCKSNHLEKDILHESINLYDAEITQTDSYIGEVLKMLESAGLMGNTIVIIYSDHGESFENNYNFQHGLLIYDSSVKVPLIIYAPGSKGKKADDLIKTSDIFATILRLADISYKDNGSENVDFSNVVRSQPDYKSLKDRAIFFMNNEATKYGIRKGDYKYILSLESDLCSQKGRRELYNLKSDPDELHNLIDKEQGVAKDLNEILTKYLSNNPLEIIHPRTLNHYKNSIENVENKQKIIEELKSLGY